MNTNHPTDTVAAARARAWQLLLAARSIMESAEPVAPVGLHYNTSTGEVDIVSGTDLSADLLYSRQRWVYRDSLPQVTTAMLDLYLAVLGTHANPSVVVGHLGQSVDARIATTGGDAFFVTGEENRAHLHCMRALCHAVLVGAETVVVDNPQLTTRAVVGPHPIRVVLDPKGRVTSENSLFTDEQTPTWLIHNSTVDVSRRTDPAHVKRIVMSGTESRLFLPDVVQALRDRGVYRVFVEGGGVTVSSMLNSNCLHRVQIAVAPLLVGEGRAALQLPAAKSMQSAMRPSYRLFRMGEDVLWDFDLTDTRYREGLVRTETVFERLL